MKITDLYEHTPEQLIKARQIAITTSIKKHKITPPTWMARNWEFVSLSLGFNLKETTKTTLPEDVSNCEIWYEYSTDRNIVSIMLYFHTTYYDYDLSYRQTLLPKFHSYISSVYKEVFGKTPPNYQESYRDGAFVVDDPDLLTPELKNAIQTKKLNIMDPITFQVLHEYAKDQETIK
jgi:hypothetical protein